MKWVEVHTENRSWLDGFKKLDIPFLSLALTLVLIGVINFYSITQLSPVFWRQILWLVIGIFLFIFLSLINYKVICKLSWLIYSANITALVLLLFFGQTLQGAKRWFDLGWFSFQPAETMQLSLVCLLSYLFSKKSVDFIYGFKQILPAFLLTVLPMALIIFQPDLGTALLIGIQSCTLVCFLKITRNVFISIIGLILIIAPSMWFFVLKDYQKNRILTFVSASQDPYGAGYNSIQSKIAIGSGRMLGKGFSQGTQAQLEFLPERHTDFVFSVLSEEHGFIGSIVTLALFLFLIIKILKIALQSRNKEGVYLCLGAVSIIFWKTFVNIGMAVGLLPVVGVPLPFLSYGGSSMISAFCALGLISSVLNRRYFYSKG